MSEFKTTVLKKVPSIVGLRGTFDDKWVATSALLEIRNTKSISIDMFLPKSDPNNEEAGDSKTVSFYHDYKKIYQIELVRDNLTTVKLDFEECDGPVSLRIITEYPEPLTADDLRLLGFVCAGCSLQGSASENVRLERLPAPEPSEAVALDDPALAGADEATQREASFSTTRELIDERKPSTAPEVGANVRRVPATVDAADRASYELARLAPFFDEAFYRESNPDLEFDQIAPLEHFFRIGWREGRDPSDEFSVKGYLHHNPDVREADMNPLLHYVLAGRREGRISRPAQKAPRPADGRSEWLGYKEVRAFGYDSQEGRTPDYDALGFCHVFAGLDPSAIAKKINLPAPDAAEDLRVSIVIPCLNEQVTTLECLASIEKAAPDSFGIEVIVVDNASSDPAYRAIARNPTLRYLRSEKNEGFGPACNAGARMARGEFVFFLNNDAQIAPGCLEALVNAASQEGVGLVGPKIMSFDGTLQEAGCLLNSDGSGALIGFGRDHRTPRYNYARDVEHISGAAILLRRALFDELGGFDDIYAPAYCEDADLSLKIRRRGLRVLYEPKALVAHHLSKTSSAGVKSNQSRVWTQLIQYRRAATRHRPARKFRAVLS